MATTLWHFNLFSPEQKRQIRGISPAEQQQIIATDRNFIDTLFAPPILECFRFHAINNEFLCFSATSNRKLLSVFCDVDARQIGSECVEQRHGSERRPHNLFSRFAREIVNF